MSKKALVYASVASMIQQFNMNNVRILLERGYQVDVACNMEEGSTISAEKVDAMRHELGAMGCRVFHIPVPRSPSAVGAFVASLRQTRQRMNMEGYELVHCHSPIGGVICRVANRLSRYYGRTRMIYTAHGFHFYTGAPLKNWLLYYPVEWLCAHFTDVLITINKEDYERARKKMKAKRVEYVPGVGIDLTKFGHTPIDKAAKRRELGVPEDARLLLSVGELNENKNHETVIRAIADLDVYYAIAGEGDLHEHLQGVIDELGLSGRVKLLGYRDDVAELYQAADVCVFPSFREGLGLAAIEGMACGLPLIVADNRGTREFCEDGKNGFVCAADSVDDFSRAIGKLLEDATLRETFGQVNKTKAQRFGISPVNEKMTRIYQYLESDKVRKAN